MENRPWPRPPPAAIRPTPRYTATVLRPSRPLRHSPMTPQPSARYRATRTTTRRWVLPARRARSPTWARCCPPTSPSTATPVSPRHPLRRPILPPHLRTPPPPATPTPHPPPPTPPPP